MPWRGRLRSWCADVHNNISFVLWKGGLWNGGLYSTNDAFTAGSVEHLHGHGHSAMVFGASIHKETVADSAARFAGKRMGGV